MNEAETLNQTDTQDPNQAPETEVSLELDDSFAQLQAEHEELQQQMLRHLADFQNFRRRTEQEKAQVRQYATEDLVVQLLPVLDNFERALRSVESGASLEALVEGLRMVDRQLRQALESQKVVRIPSEGQPFDPDLHEAIATEHTNDHPEDTVVLELEAGYKMAERVIRPARVKVAKPKK